MILLKDGAMFENKLRFHGTILKVSYHKIVNSSLYD